MSCAPTGIGTPKLLATALRARGHIADLGAPLSLAAALAHQLQMVDDDEVGPVLAPDAVYRWRICDRQPWLVVDMDRQPRDVVLASISAGQSTKRRSRRDAAVGGNAGCAAIHRMANCSAVISSEKNAVTLPTVAALTAIVPAAAVLPLPAGRPGRRDRPRPCRG